MKLQMIRTERLDEPVRMIVAIPLADVDLVFAEACSFRSLDKVVWQELTVFVKVVCQALSIS